MTSTKSPPNPILLSLFANRFMSVAESMGLMLQKTAISTNIKERLDFSCAIFAPNGDLIANAPHLPVHLGSMSFAVRFQIEHLEGGIHEGDVILSNHPRAGGSHLPDLTMITPVFQDGKIVFYTASRGHFSDIGGIVPGSMPPTSKTIFEEGAQILSFKIVEKGIYKRDELVKILVDDPAQYPGCSGTRCLGDVESDLKAQIAANNKGVKLIYGIVKEYGLDTVIEYMHHIRDNAEAAVRTLLRKVAKEHGTNKLHAIDYLDDGTPIELLITIDAEAGSALFDFEGTGPEIYGNLNAPISITYSAIIYCLRSMVDLDIPLNQGCLIPIEVKVPPLSVLSPSYTAAVVGGNVCTSQRICDVILTAFQACANSYGDMNNLSFGSGGINAEGIQIPGYGMYETICGGSGAGPTWEGTSGVQAAMTNTKCNDPEIFERRYPIILHQFAIREGSGGAGLHKGGDGVIKEIEFLEPLQVSILSERRVYAPNGMNGGSSAKRGENYWIKTPRPEDGDTVVRKINLGGKATIKMGTGDRIMILTPGGGGWGKEGGEQNLVGKEGFNRGDSRGSVKERGSNMDGA